MGAGKKAFLRMNDLNKIKLQRICTKHLNFLYEGPINSTIISTRARILLLKILKIQPRLTKEIAKLSIIGRKDFSNRYRDCVILGSADLLECFYY